MAEVLNFPKKLHYNDDGEPCYCNQAMALEGFDDCLAGTAIRPGMNGPVFCYDIDKLIPKLVEREGLSEDEAFDWFHDHILDSWAGEGTPIFIYPRLEKKDEKGNQGLSETAG